MVGGILRKALTALSPQDRRLPDGSEACVAGFTGMVATAIANPRTEPISSRLGPPAVGGNLQPRAIWLDLASATQADPPVLLLDAP